MPKGGDSEMNKEEEVREKEEVAIWTKVYKYGRER